MSASTPPAKAQTPRGRLSFQPTPRQPETRTTSLSGSCAVGFPLTFTGKPDPGAHESFPSYPQPAAGGSQ